MTATYSMMRRTHWKLVVQRMPHTQMNVMMASQTPARMAWFPTLAAEEAEIHPTWFMNCNV